MAKEAPFDINRLLSSIQGDRRFLKPYREKRVSAVSRFVGTNWSDDAAIKAQPVNLISLFVEVVARQLIPKNPRFDISTFQRENKPAVGTMKQWVNQKIEDIDLAQTLRRARVDGLFSLGIIKVALSTPADAGRFTWKMNAGEPFAEVVDLDDFFYQTRSRDFNQAGYMGHFYTVPLDIIRDDSRNYSKARKDLIPSDPKQTNYDGDDRIDVLGGVPTTIDSSDFEDMIDLCEVYVARHKLVYTFTRDQVEAASMRGDADGKLEPLRVQNWIGPDKGPYHILGDMVVPGNAMPKAKVMDLIELHDSANDAMRKLMGQAKRLKSVLATQGQDEDVERARKEEDGGVFRSSGPNLPKETTYGGPKQELMVASQLFQEQFSKHAGNLETMGGLSPQAGTLGQERLLAENSNRAIADLQGNTITFVQEVGKALCWYWWNDPFKVMRVKLPVSQGIEIERRLTPQKRAQTKWEDLNIKINPFSMQAQTPSSKLQFIIETVTKLALPMMPILQKDNISMDASRLFELIGELGDSPELLEIFTVRESPAQQTESETSGEAPPMPQETTRNYNRTSQSTATGPGQNKMRMTALMGMNPGGSPNGNGEA
jgi:hypothetical protein